MKIIKLGYIGKIKFTYHQNLFLLKKYLIKLKLYLNQLLEGVKKFISMFKIYK